MSHLFFDHLVNLDEVKREIDKLAETPEEKEELWAIVDETIHHRVLGCVFDHLPYEHHQEFADMLEATPHDKNLLVYLKDKIQQNIEKIIKSEIRKLSTEILEEVRF